MSIQSERIKSEMQKHSFTLLEIERKTGIKKSSMQRYMSGETGKIPLDVIKKLAEAFGVSAAYLMGWEESDQNKNSPAEVQLSEGQRLLLDLYDQLPEDKQRMFIEMLRAAAKAL